MNSHNYSTDDDLANSEIREQAATTAPVDESMIPDSDENGLPVNDNDNVPGPLPFTAPPLPPLPPDPPATGHGMAPQTNGAAPSNGQEPITTEMPELNGVGAFEHSYRAPVRRVLHPFDVPSAIDGSPESSLEMTLQAMSGHEPPDDLGANQSPPPSGPPAANPPNSPGPPRREPPVEQQSSRRRSPDTDEVPVVAAPPTPHTSSTALISGGIGEAPVGDPVDQIAVRKLGGFNFLNIPQWMSLPRDEKARLIKGELVTFMYEGEEVSLRAALLFLQNLNRDGDDRW